MADRSVRPVESIEEGDRVLSREAVTGRLLPQLVLRNKASQVDYVVALHLSNGSVLEMSLRQPVVLSDGKLTKALHIAMRIDPQAVLPGATEVANVRTTESSLLSTDMKIPLQLRDAKGAALTVIGARIVPGPRTVYWLETRQHRNIFAHSAELSTLPIIKEI